MMLILNLQQKLKNVVVKVSSEPHGVNHIASLKTLRQMYTREIVKSKFKCPIFT